MSNDYSIEGSSVKKSESTFTIDPDIVKPMPDLDYAKGWLREKIGNVIDSDVVDNNPFVDEGISLTLRIYSARGKKTC